MKLTKEQMNIATKQMEATDDREIPPLLPHESSWVVCQPNGRPIREVPRDEGWILNTYPLEHYVIKTITQHISDAQHAIDSGDESHWVFSSEWKPARGISE